MPSKLKKAIGAVKDQTSISLAKVASNNSSSLEVAVLKATTHDDIPIDDRYVYEILQLVSSNKFYAASCARAIGKRIGRTRNWVVALKSLMLVLRIFQDGDPYFPREVLHAMKRGAKILNLSTFRDDSNSSPWDFTAFVRTFALYLDERLDCFLTGKLQRRYTQRDRESWSYHRNKRPKEPVGDMKPAMLLDRISYWQRLLERAIATRPTGAAKMNRLVKICLYAIVQESFDLYKDISDGLALLLDSFFHLHYQNCVSAFQACIKATSQFEELSGFYSLCKSMGVGRTSEYPSIQAISEELIETLQEFLKDHSSFPTNSKSPDRPLPLPAPPPNADQKLRRHDTSGGQSEYSATNDRFSEQTFEYSSQGTSLEDLISATEIGRRPSISIDLEAYSDQFEKRTQQDDAFRVSELGSSHSLPVSNSMTDLVSLNDWSDPDEKECKQDQEHEQKPKPSESTTSMIDWEIDITETLSASLDVPSNNAANNFNAFPEQELAQTEENNASVDHSRNHWELVQFTETTEPQAIQPLQNNNSLSATSLDSLYNQSTLPSNHYNPFLQDVFEFPVAATMPEVAIPTTATIPEVGATNMQVAAQIANIFSSAPTFSAQNPNEVSFAAQIENDPFAPYSSTTFSNDQMFNSTMSQQNLLQEQQLWLQNQNKIIAKHMV
ncbi:clathrin coat assembly protein AP180 isoform X1 [Olea europaea var. sylvestris]|uniref:clathrin coat assembly protein AP180 isoform X1 n=1 Tax=Olea europaea var. sylvestris TaxID=158386 RepID=UPI000C1D600F|nr:clathrin coat assembly protein AP180 isoform X1 [Olea europaea var. sylvestris]